MCIQQYKCTGTLYIHSDYNHKGRNVYTAIQINVQAHCIYTCKYTNTRICIKAGLQYDIG